MLGYNRQPSYHARTVTMLCIKALTGLESHDRPIFPLLTGAVGFVRRLMSHSYRIASIPFRHALIN